MRKWFGRTEPLSFDELRDGLLAEHDRYVGAVRVSVGVASDFRDVYRFTSFMQRFVDRSAHEIDGHAAVADGARVEREAA